MTLQRSFLAVIATLLVAATSRADTVLLQDNFNDNSLDTSKWTTVIPAIAGAPSVTEQNGHIELQDRGWLVTRDQFDPSLVGPLTITGTWTYATTSFDFQQGDYLQVFTRSNAQPQGPPYGEVLGGIGFILRPKQMGNPQLMYIVSQGGSALASTSAFQLDPGDTINFKIADDGTNVAFSFQEVGGQGASASLTAATSDRFGSSYIVFYNADRNANTAPKVSYLDDVTVRGSAAVPEPSGLISAALGLATLAGYAAVRRHRARIRGRGRGYGDAVRREKV